MAAPCTNDLQQKTIIKNKIKKQKRRKKKEEKKTILRLHCRNAEVMIHMFTTKSEPVRELYKHIFFDGEYIMIEEYLAVVQSLHRQASFP